ncbi:MAG: FAD:protein FMN transferase [Acidimicrobiales bacterium]
MIDSAVHRFPVMGTTAEILANGIDHASLVGCATILEDLEARWSRFLPTSEISQLNRAARRAQQSGFDSVPVVVSDDTFRLIAMAIDLWEQTDGVFDPTIGVSMEAAGYDRSFELLDAQHAPRREQAPAGYQPAPGAGDIVLDEPLSAVRIPAGVVIDLGGIAKGVAVDLLAEHLLSIGAQGCCVNIGGDLRALGTPPRPEGWQVAIDCPGAAEPVTVGLVAGAVCTTSKSKRRWRAAGAAGGVEHHLRDPATGAPLESGVTSVTVIGARATQAEVLCKVAFAAGVERGPGLVERQGATGLIVGDDGTVSAMCGLDAFTAAALSGNEHSESPAAACGVAR